MHLSPRDDSIDRAVALADAHAALIEVYRYLHHRCGFVALAEDLSSEAVLAAAADKSGNGKAPVLVHRRS